jgi:hypothetical protein
VAGERPLNLTDVDVAVTGVYQRRRQMTWTYRSSTGLAYSFLRDRSQKVDMLVLLRKGDRSIPAERIRQDWGRDFR